jgi:hypothetical protein
MHIGLDFDNTIVGYDSLFHKVALEGGWIDHTVPISKVSVRDHLRSIGKEDVWTEMQGYVYGARMDEAAVYEGVVDTLLWAKNNKIKLSIVSHKTKHPFIGEQYNLHEAARNWIKLFLNANDEPLIPLEDIHFELTKESKIDRIAKINCDIYLDDLPEILLAPSFSNKVKKILFDPDNHHSNQNLERVKNWVEVRDYFESQWCKIS